MSVERAFFDTNVLIYAATSGEPREGIADALMSRGGFVSVQVLNEFVAVSRHKRRASWPEILQALYAFRGLLQNPLPITMDLHLHALQISQEHGYHIYDSLIIASAVEAGCTVLYSEDLQDGKVIEGLTIRNPFR